MNKIQKMIELKEICENNSKLIPDFYANAHKTICEKIMNMTIEEAEEEI